MPNSFISLIAPERDRNEIWSKFICNFLLRCTNSENLRNLKSAPPPKIRETRENYFHELLKNKWKKFNLLIHILWWSWKVQLFTTNSCFFQPPMPCFIKGPKELKNSQGDSKKNRFKRQQLFSGTWVFEKYSWVRSWNLKAYCLILSCVSCKPS